MDFSQQQQPSALQSIIDLLHQQGLISPLESNHNGMSAGSVQPQQQQAQQQQQQGGSNNPLSKLQGMGSLFNSGVAAVTDLPWLSSGTGLAGVGNSLSALGSMFL